jgi:hypothetical protein
MYYSVIFRNEGQKDSAVIYLDMDDDGFMETELEEILEATFGICSVISYTSSSVAPSPN